MQRKQSFPHTFDDRISAHRINLERALEATSDPTKKHEISRKLRQLQTATDINQWLTSPDLKSPD